MCLNLYDAERLKRAQDASLKILLETDRLCRLHGISYLLDSGTLLGAVRHRGFIPWDDDADIAMTRKNFESFRKHSAELREGFELLMPDGFAGGERFYDFTPRIIYLNSKRRTAAKEQDYYGGRLNHLWVDIFILDNIPDERLCDRLVRLEQKIIYGLSMSRRFNIDWAKYSKGDRCRVKLLTFIGKHISMKELFVRQEKLSKKYSGMGTKRLYYSNYQPDYMDRTLERGWSENTAELEFEGHMFMAPENYDAVLKAIYGNYMELPPEDCRIPSHSDDIEVY